MDNLKDKPTQKNGRLLSLTEGLNSGFGLILDSLDQGIHMVDLC
ncbi:MAG: hypothetical protein ACOY30_09770 [Bacillota bacterium]